MSRALDAATAAALKRGNPQAAYAAISHVLTHPPQDGLLEIEILGRTHPLPDGQYLIQDGRAAGISKLGLVQAFLLARQRLHDHLDGASPQPPDEVFALTAVILLFDPEYLTAANTRKRLIIQSHLSSPPPGGATTPDLVLAREKHYLDSLLTSRLHRHTKSPVLWSHRRWLVGLLPPQDILADLTEVVFVAGERHPRNYYAWCHARFLVGRAGVSKEMVDAVRGWCFQHHTDTSGWSFLGFLLTRREGVRREDVEETVGEVLGLVEGLRLGNESVWVFLRTLAGDEAVVGEGLYERFRAVQGGVLAGPKTAVEEKVLRAAGEWSEAYRGGTHNAGA